MKNEQPMDIILNSTAEELTAEFSTWDLGTLQSFKNLFTMKYEQQRLAKDELLKKLDKQEVTKEEADKTLSNMYVLMQKLEDVCTIIVEVINNLNKK